MLYLVQSGTIQVRESLGGQTLATATDETLKLQPAIKKHTACAHAHALVHAHSHARRTSISSAARARERRHLVTATNKCAVK